jgi:hypothetical protein
MSTLTARRQGGRPQPVSEKSITPVSTEAPLARWQETALAPGQAMPVYKCTCGALAPYSAAVMAPSLGATDMLAPRPLAPFPILGAVEAMVAGAQLAPFGFFDAGLLFHRIQRGALLPSPSHPGALQLACRFRNFRHALPGRSFFQTGRLAESGPNHAMCYTEHFESPKVLRRTVPVIPQPLTARPFLFVKQEEFMTESDLVVIAILVLALLYALMTPPGPGTPLLAPVRQR